MYVRHSPLKIIPCGWLRGELNRIKINVTRDVRKTKNSLHVAERLPHNIVCTLCIHKKKCTYSHHIIAFDGVRNWVCTTAHIAHNALDRCYRRISISFKTGYCGNIDRERATYRFRTAQQNKLEKKLQTVANF